MVNIDMVPEVVIVNLTAAKVRGMSEDDAWTLWDSLWVDAKEDQFRELWQALDVDNPNKETI